MGVEVQSTVCRMALERVNRCLGSESPFFLPYDLDASVWKHEPRLAALSLAHLFLDPLYIVPNPPHIRPRPHPRDDFSFDQRQRYGSVESRVSRKGRVVA